MKSTSSLTRYYEVHIDKKYIIYGYFILSLKKVGRIWRPTASTIDLFVDNNKVPICFYDLQISNINKKREKGIQSMKMAIKMKHLIANLDDVYF